MGKKKSESNEQQGMILPLLTLENIVLTPTIPQPVKIDKEEQREFLDKCYGANSEVFIVTVDESSKEVKEDSIKKVGVVCIIDRILQMPGAPTLAFIRPQQRAEFQGTVYSPAYPMAKIKPLKQISAPSRLTEDVKLMLARADELYKALISFIPEPERENAEKLVEENSKTVVNHLYAILHVSPVSWEEKYRALECNTFRQLLDATVISLDEAEQRINIQASIHQRTHHELSQQQREAFLRMHLKNIKEELGESDDSDDVAELTAKSADKKWNDEVQKHFNKEIQKLRRLNPNNPEYSVQYEYLESLLKLPWDKYNNKQFSLKKVEEILERDHYGLENVKERVLEHIAVLKLRNDLKAPIICLYGPPGVGKTSIGKSIAEAVGRQYARIALGGVHDEAEIRGHRKTYIGAMPGRFMQTLSKLEYGNPLILLDEIDKVGKDYKGDPSSALLEALDPEQNNTFHDNFIDFPYDLSRVLFIATANDLSTIPPPLRDRMEVIEMAGYTLEEKKEIALRHLVDQALKDNGFKEKDIVFTPEAIETIIRSFTHEKGVRQLKMQISRIIRKLALQKVKGKKLPDEITGKLVTQFLDKKDSWHSSLGFRG